MKNKKITIAGVPFSDNLGDYAIYYSLMNMLENNNKDITPLDLAGRRDFHKKKITSGFSLKQKIISSQNAVLNWFFTFGNAVYVSMRKNNENNVIIKSSDYVLIGGGNLLSDNYGNFPIKLWFLYRLIKKHNVNYSIVSVGVGNNWSWLAKLIFTKITRDAEKVSVRDTNSKMLLEKFTGRKDIEIICDPAIMMSSILQQYNKKSKQGTIGINVVDWGSLFFSSDLNTKEKYLNFNYNDFYKCIALYYISLGYNVAFFTNGADEDNKYLVELKKYLKEFDNKNVSFHIIEDFTSLVDTITSCEKIISSRLHSIIIASSYSIPTVGLVWDNKVRSFYNVLSCGDNYIELDELVTADSDGLLIKIDSMFPTNTVLSQRINMLKIELEKFISNY
ncbi:MULTISPECIES: polysaccharide pyruvyl transferase family protein [Klebsiella]|uniref:polysaccharide pyruvyl transferase family protein n=1 Tax=Klebsiella TaxID=570 RepID=UPI000651D280|nr:MULTISPECIES: polysaccharide pyruvyl transferase family protein [Klebsiella]KMH47857.1 hypothetical protein SM73_03619 [Klebsiella quasipneumoniae]HBR1319109.1 polysaccharide pyruvyl transferase family protein [Klebsiella quasipneumoniae subsp. quasipneumoniae]